MVSLHAFARGHISRDSTITVATVSIHLPSALGRGLAGGRGFGLEGGGGWKFKGVALEATISALQ
jgi:hypothetical protein